MTNGIDVRKDILNLLCREDVAINREKQAKFLMGLFHSTVLAASMFACSGISAATNTEIPPDLDSDGITDAADNDQDNDGISNSLEGLYRVERLSDSPAQYYEVAPLDAFSYQGSSYRYTLVSVDGREQINLNGRVIGSDTVVEWGMHDSLPKVRNLKPGRTSIEWSFGLDESQHNIDMTVSDLDGSRAETIVVSVDSLIGYSLSLNSNILVLRENGLIFFVGTGEGGQSSDDAVSLHIRQVSSLVIEYKSANDSNANFVAGSVAADGSEIAGFRHRFDHQSATHGLAYFYPLAQVRDTDTDGIPDHRDLDSDNDGLGDVIEAGGIDANGDNMMDGGVDQLGVPQNTTRYLTVELAAPAYEGDVLVDGDDLDADGVLASIDDLPNQFGGSRLGLDTDSDGLYDLDEIRIHRTDPNKPDTDEDGLTDLSELQRYLTNPLRSDTDNDGIADYDELMVYGTIPVSSDSDLDGIDDGEEVEQGSDPLVADIQNTLEPHFDEAATNRLEPVSNLSEDPPQIGDAGSLRTGLTGAAGCSINGAANDPSLPLWLTMALVGLMVRRNA